MAGRTRSSRCRPPCGWMELIDNADLSVYSHCGHWSMIERTEDFNRSVSEFFSD